MLQSLTPSLFKRIHTTAMLQPAAKRPAMILSATYPEPRCSESWILSLPAKGAKPRCMLGKVPTHCSVPTHIIMLYKQFGDGSRPSYTSLVYMWSPEEAHSTRVQPPHATRGNARWEAKVLLAESACQLIADSASLCTA